MDRQEKALYLFLFFMPFLVGGYLVWSSALAACFLLFFLCRKEENRAKKKAYNENLLALALLPVLFLLAGFWGVDRGQAAVGFVKFVPLPLFWLAVRRIPDEKRARLWDAVPAGGFLMTMVSILLWCIPSTREWVQVNGRLAGFFQYPNTYAVYLLCGILIRSGRVHDQSGRDIAESLVLAAGILLSGSRTAMGLASAAAVLLLHKRGNGSLRRIFPVLAGGGILALALFTATGNLDVLKRYGVLPLQSSTFLGRVLYAADALPVIAGHPFGLGYEGYWFLQGSFQNGVYAVRHVHNELFQLLLDVGWLPAAVLLHALGKTFWRLGFHKRMVLSVLLLHSLLDFDFQFLSIGLLLALLMAEGEDPGICVLEKRNLRRKSVKKRAGREKKKTGALGGFGSRMGAVFLAVFCLWIGTADFLAYIKKPEAVVRIYPAHTRSLMELLKQAETLEEMEQIADRILRYNESVSLAYDAKGNVAYAEGDAEKMIACKLRAIALARYEREEYEDYLERLFTFIRLYQNAGMTRSASYCRERLLEIPDMLEEVKRTASPLAWMIYDKPDLELTKEMQARIRILRESEP